MSARLRQAVIAARDLEATAGHLREQLGLGAPYHDPAVAMFGLRNSVFALRNSFLEVVSPVEAGVSAARLLDRRGPVCGYMLMFQVDDLDAARARAGACGVREVFEIELEDMDEVHLHPGDLRGAIVALSRPNPAASWRWGGPGWGQRNAPLGLGGAEVAVNGATQVSRRWETILGVPPADAGVRLVENSEERGVVEILLTGESPTTLELGGVRLRVEATEEER